jgi:hypothetical protein
MDMSWVALTLDPTLPARFKIWDRTLPSQVNAHRSALVNGVRVSVPSLVNKKEHTPVS